MFGRSMDARSDRQSIEEHRAEAWMLKNRNGIALIPSVEAGVVFFATSLTRADPRENRLDAGRGSAGGVLSGRKLGKFG